jgi:hypothetical protein
MKSKLIAVWLFGAIAVTVTGQQVPDTAYSPVLKNPAYALNNYRLLLNIIHWLDGR